MSKLLETKEALFDTYKGILINNPLVNIPTDKTIKYDFDLKEFGVLRERYNLDKIAGSGTDFKKVMRLLNHFSKSLKHSSFYDNHIEQNSLELLKYSYQTENGINCLNKSKILVEVLLALNIYARQVSINPLSPYDFDNHVVCEFYDWDNQKWIMIDPSTNGYFVDETYQPLSLLEIRYKFANDEFLTFITSTTREKNLVKVSKKYLDLNIYFCKNLFLFKVFELQTFGLDKTQFIICNQNFDYELNTINNTKYKIKNIPKEYSSVRTGLEQRLFDLENTKDKTAYGSTNLLLKKPLR